MQPTEPRHAPSHATSAALPPQLERTLVAAGWSRAELRSPVRSPLANLRIADLEASIAGPAPTQTTQSAGPRRPAPPRSPDDPSATRAANEWAWMEAFAAVPWANPGETLITPSRRRETSPAEPRAAPYPATPTLDATQAVPQMLREALGAEAGVEGAAAREAATAESPASAPAVPAELPALPPVAERPQLVPGVQLLGTMPDTGFAEQQWLAQRGEAFIQLSELLYRVLEQVDGQRDLEEIAALVRAATGRPVSANNVRLLIAARLLPLGLIVSVGGLPVAAQPGAPSARSPLAITLRLGFLKAEWVEPIARVLQVGFWPPLLLPILVLVAAGQGWLFLAHGVAAPLEAVLRRPLLLLGISSFLFLSAVFHELGHASALRYGGGRARGIGFGVYFIYPAFYTDCTDSYRLGRWARLRTDLGGVYFDLITSLGLILAYVATRQEALLAAVILLDLEILDQFNPIARFDGYWALADLVGVPDFFTLMGPVLRGARETILRPFRRQRQGQPATPTGAAPGAHAPALKGWVRVVFLAYTVVTVPLLAIFLGVLLASVPSFLGFYGDSLAEQVTAAIAALRDGARLELALASGQALTLLVTAVLLLYGIGNTLRSLIRAIWRWGAPTSRRRGVAIAAIAGGLALLLYVWQPQVAALAPHFAQLARQISAGR